MEQLIYATKGNNMDDIKELISYLKKTGVENVKIVVSHEVGKRFICKNNYASATEYTVDDKDYFAITVSGFGVLYPQEEDNWKLTDEESEEYIGYYADVSIKAFIKEVKEEVKDKCDENAMIKAFKLFDILDKKSGDI